MFAHEITFCPKKTGLERGRFNHPSMEELSILTLFDQDGTIVSITSEFLLARHMSPPLQFTRLGCREPKRDKVEENIPKQ